jgi:hypothetical protein
VKVPTSVTVPPNATSAGFTASVLAVTGTQTATLTAATSAGSSAFSLQLVGGVPTLSASTTAVSFGNVIAGQTASQSLTLSSTGTAPVTISGTSIVGSLFTSSGIATPFTLNPGQTATLNLVFASPHASTFTGVLTIANNSSLGNIVVNMSAAGVAAPTLSAISCSVASMSAAGTDACTVSLTAAAPSGGTSVSLASNNAAVKVPPSVTVPANATSIGFTAAVASVSSSQAATISATAGSASSTFSLQLAPAGVGTLAVNAGSISFGNVALNEAATQSVTLTSSGTSAVTINSATVTGSGFIQSGVTFPITLNPGQTATLNVQFDPTATGAATGALTFMSNSSTGGTTVVGLSGTGQSYQVDLTWDAPGSSTDPVSGYHVYRATQGSSSYQLLNSSVDVQTNYTDSTGQSGAAYEYYVTTVDSAGAESGPSNTTSVTIP